MKYEDLNKMYWALTELFNDLIEDDDLTHLIVEHEFQLNWILDTLHEEMRELEG